MSYGTPWHRRKLNALIRKIEGASAMAYGPHPFLNFLRAFFRRSGLEPQAGIADGGGDRPSSERAASDPGEAVVGTPEPSSLDSSGRAGPGREREQFVAASAEDVVGTSSARSGLVLRDGAWRRG